MGPHLRCPLGPTLRFVCVPSKKKILLEGTSLTTFQNQDKLLFESNARDFSDARIVTTWIKREGFVFGEERGCEVGCVTLSISFLTGHTLSEPQRRLRGTSDRDSVLLVPEQDSSGQTWGQN